MAKTKAKRPSRGEKADIGISWEAWEWVRANPRYEDLMDELEDLEELRREKPRRGKASTSLKC